MAAEAAEVLVAPGPVHVEAELGTWIPANWRTSASAGVLGVALAGPAGGAVADQLNISPSCAVFVKGLFYFLANLQLEQLDV